MDANNSSENAQYTIIGSGHSFNLDASEIHVSKTCAANFISSEWSVCNKLHGTNANL